MSDKSIWGHLYDEEAIGKVQNVVAASIGADANDAVLLEEIERLCTWMLDDKEQVADRFLRVVSGMTMLTRTSIDQFATVIETSKLAPEDTGAEPDREAVRNTMVYLLEQYAHQLRDVAGR